MNLIESLANYLQDSGIGTVNTNIFIGELPYDISDCISINSTSSPEPNKSVPYFIQTVDVWARFKNSETGYNKMYDVFDLIHRKAAYEIDGIHIYISYAMGSIEDMDRDSERRKLYKLSLGFVFRSDEAS